MERNDSVTVRIVSAMFMLCLVGCGARERVETRQFDGPTMGTTYHVTVPGIHGDTDARRVQGCIDRTLVDVDRHLSTYSSTSEISTLNANESTGWIPVSPTLAAVVSAAQRVSIETDGAFDITVAPLVRLWGFGSGASAVAGQAFEPPSLEFVHDAMANVGHSWLELRLQPEPAVRKGKVPLELDVDGIAPGYAVDRVSACLARSGFTSHLVELGGEVRATGRREGGQGWRVAIEAPVMEPHLPYAGVELTDLAVSTSGNYRDFRRLPNGQVLSHTIDPRTGEPIRHALASVTVVHPRAILADAYATALMVAGPEDGLAMAERLGLPALFLERIGDSQALRERATPAFEHLRRPVQ